MSSSLHSCCTDQRGFNWNGTPFGTDSKLANNDAYITGSNPDVAILLVHDLFGWTFPNIRLLADHYANEVGATVYVPDFFGGHVLPADPIRHERWHEIDLESFHKHIDRNVREPELLACARALRSRYKRVGAAGFCYGGWACFRLGAQSLPDSTNSDQSSEQRPLVDAIVVGHPTFLTKDDIDNASVPVKILAPEHDPVYTAELKEYTFQTLQKRNVDFSYVYFPGVKHSFCVRGNEEDVAAMERAKREAVGWLREWLYPVQGA